MIILKSERWLNSLERRIGKFSVPGLMNIIITGMVIVWIMDEIICPVSGKIPLSYFISFNKYSIMHGQVWRLVTFIFDPITRSPFWMIFTFYFYWLIGQVLERQWGVFRFNFFYFTGVIGAVIGGFITGYATNTFLTMSLFLAFAVIAPDFEMLLFFIIPVKIKYLAMLDGLLLAWMFITGGPGDKILIVFSLINFFIFFGDGFIEMMKYRIHHWKYKFKNRK